MRFKTVIKLVSDANNKNEALEVVEEYLAGNIVSGVDMKCATKPLYNKTKIAGAVVLFFMVAVCAFLFSNSRHSQCALPVISGASAVQAPLNTACIAESKEYFKRNWENRHTKEALDYITK